MGPGPALCPALRVLAGSSPCSILAKEPQQLPHFHHTALWCREKKKDLKGGEIFLGTAGTVESRACMFHFTEGREGATHAGFLKPSPSNAVPANQQPRA